MEWLFNRETEAYRIASCMTN